MIKHNHAHKQLTKNSRKGIRLTMNQKKMIGVTAAVLAFLVFFMIIDYVQKKRAPSVSPNILSLTQPVTSFSGRVDKIEGNTLVVSQQYISLPTGTMPTSQPTIVTYRIVVDNKTRIFQLKPAPYYLFKTGVSEAGNSPTIQNIKVGQIITVNTDTDLRTLASDSPVEATIINLPSVVTTLNGTVTDVTGNILTIKGIPVLPPPIMNSKTQIPTGIPGKTYHIKVTSDTELSHLSAQGMPQRYVFSKISVGTQITVYADVDVSTQTEITALRVDPTILQ